MRLPLHEHLRLRREREFQSRVLAALERPKRGKLAAFVNSPFFLWLLSIVFVTMGSIYFNTQQQCLRDARQIADNYKRIVDELGIKKFAIYYSVMQARSMEDVRKTMRSLPWLYSDLRERSLRQLDKEMDDIVYSHMAGGVRRELSFVPGYLASEAKFMALWDGYFDSSLTDRDLGEMKRVIQANSQHWMKQVELGRYSTVEPWCSPPRIFGLIAGTEKTMVMSTVWPDFYQLDFANASADGIPTLEASEYQKKSTPKP
jgi:hypothetical protein